MKKRFSAFLLALIYVLMLSACGSPAANSSLPVLESDAGTSVPAGPSAIPETGQAETESPESQKPETQESEAQQPETQESETPGPEIQEPEAQEPETQEPAPAVSEDGWYSSKEDVALYIHLYGHLPDNYISKREAQELGWTGGSVERYAGEGTAIGGSRFGNYEGLLPEAKGRTYTECDIDTVGGSGRGAKRVVFSNDGLIYYTEEHYESFELLYGEP